VKPRGEIVKRRPVANQDAAILFRAGTGVVQELPATAGIAETPVEFLK
jgi:hypothetical protein